MVIVPRIVSIRWLFRLLFACTFLLTHRQFALQYPPLLSIRSRVKPGEYEPFMSSQKLAKLRHLSSTVMPRPP